MIEKYLSQIGSRIKKIRSTLKVTQKEMATMSGLSLGFISEIENGKKRPSVLVHCEMEISIARISYYFAYGKRAFF